MSHRLNLVFSSLALSGVMMLGGCAAGGGGIKSTDCNANWESLGMIDGRDGAHSGIGEQRFAQCAGASPTPDRSAYQIGYEKGLVEFCQPKGGFLHGVAGKEYAFNCGRALEPDFIRAYQIGFAEYEYKQAVRESDREVNRADRGMQNAQTEVKRLESQFYRSSNNTSSERQRLTTEVNRLRRQIAQLQQDRAQHRSALDRAQKELKKYRKRRPLIPGLDATEADAASEEN